MISFDRYVLTRSYNFGRGTDEAWTFIVQAKGEAAFRSADSWDELERSLKRHGAGEPMIRGARAAWKSYQHLKWRQARRKS
ncbi:MAG TPA: hypothetical protein VNT25_04250 [Allosphingosinicella sp.]|nr:hypothetical protein [Allosphingosinicella sp.]